MNWQNPTVLISESSGSFGKELAKPMLRNYHPLKPIIISHDELKQRVMHM